MGEAFNVHDMDNDECTSVDPEAGFDVAESVEQWFLEEVAPVLGLEEDCEELAQIVQAMKREEGI